jgi:hypothetical protein
MAQKVDVYEMYGIYRNPFRVFINNFSWTVTTGYGANNFSHDLNGYYYYQDAFNQLIAPGTNEAIPPQNLVGYQNWLIDPAASPEVILADPFDVPYRRIENPVGNPLLTNNQFFLNTDTVDFGFQRIMHSVPVQLSVHYDYCDFRIGAGWSYQRTWMREMRPTAFEDQVVGYTPEFESTGFSRLFGVLGYRFYDFWWHSFVAEVQVGRFSYGRQLGNIPPGVYANIGISIEQNLSEYFRVVIRPSYDIKSYTLNMPDGGAITHRHNTFFLQAGISINIPEIPRTPIKSDHVQLKHVITDPKTGRLMEVRGQPIWKRQNPKVGENHRRLWRYKLRNRRKMHPY